MNRLGDLTDLISTGLSASGSKLVISSNVTPDITIDLAAALRPGPPPNSAVEGQSELALKLIKPEIIIQSMGAQKSVAPYGKPQAEMFSFLLFGLGAAVLLGSATGWYICRNKIGV